MSASKHTCPTCGRRPSERCSITGLSQSFATRCNEVVSEDCPDPIHDAADAAPALLKALEEIERTAQSAIDDPTKTGAVFASWLVATARAARGSKPKPPTCELCGVRLKATDTDARCYMHTHEREGTVKP